MTAASSYRAAFVAGVLSAVAMVLAVLALKDISHEEVDVTLEWGMVQVAFAITAVFHVLGLKALKKAIDGSSTVKSVEGPRDDRAPRVEA
jgi:Na+/H+ antiporter NhaC